MKETQATAGVRQRLTRAVSGIHAFFTGPGFKRYVSNIVSWIQAAILWLIAAIRGLVNAIVQYFKSDDFQAGLRRNRERLIRAGKVIQDAIKSVALLLYSVATSAPVKAGLTTTASILDRFLPRPVQKILAGVAIVVLALVLLISGPDEPQTETLPEPMSVQSDIPRFQDIPAGRERKAAFFDYFLPIIQNQNRSILELRQKLKSWRSARDEISQREADEIAEIAARYRVTDFDVQNDKSWQLLLRRVDIVPPSLALAQAANESAWGTSRFARKANNFFGQWCFSKGCGLVPAKRDPNKTHEVAAFDSPQESVQMYIRNLNRNSAYQSLRERRARLRASGESVTGHELAEGLKRYSERGMSYIKELREMIEYNKLTQHDQH